VPADPRQQGTLVKDNQPELKKSLADDFQSFLPLKIMK